MNKAEKNWYDFARRIINGREAKGWDQAQLGQRMAETINVIKSAESENRQPIQLLRNLK